MHHFRTPEDATKPLNEQNPLIDVPSRNATLNLSSRKDKQNMYACIYGSFFYTDFYTPQKIKLAGDLEGNGLERKLVLTSIIVILLTSLLGVAFRVERVQASGTIYIRADGSIGPPTANITSTDNVTYIFTDNNYDSIVVERDNILLDGQGYLLQGTGSGYGINLSGRSNVTLSNIEINAYWHGVMLNSSSSYNTVSGNNITNNWNGIWLSSSNYNTVSGNNITANNWNGIWLYHSSNNTVSGNNITNNVYGVYLSSSNYNTVSGNNITANNGNGVYLSSSNYNTVSGNNITANNVYGVYLSSSNYNTVSGNNITNNRYGVYLVFSSNNTVSGNNITNNDDSVYLWYSSNNTVSGNNITNNDHGIWVKESDYNEFYHNYIDNINQTYIESGTANIWDKGFPTGGNYWSDYEDKIPNATEIDESGIWNTPYVIDEDNVDNYPLIPEFPSFLILPLFMFASLLAVLVYRRKRVIFRV